MPDETADSAYISRKQGESDQQVAQLYLASHPDRAAAFGVQPAPTPTAQGAGMQPPKSPAEAASQQKTIEGTDQGLSRPLDTALQVGAAVGSIPLAPGANLATKAVATAAQIYAGKAASDSLGDAVKALFPGHPNVEAGARIIGALGAAGALHGPGGLVDASGAPLAAAAGEGTDGASAVTSGAGAPPSPATEVSHETPVQVTPDSAAQDLAQRQIAALKEARVGKGVAAEFGRADIATTVSEEQTMKEAAALRAKVEPFFGERRPPMAAHTAAFAKVYQDEAKGILETATELKANGITADPALEARFAAYAINYADLAGARSEVGRSLQILDPLKPDNIMATNVAKLAQDLAADPNANLIAKLGALDTEQQAVFARQIGEAATQGRSVTGMVREYYMNALLSKPSTFVAKKVTGDITSYGLEIPTRYIASKIPMWGGDKVAPEEAGAFARQSIAATQDALRIAKLTFENGTSAIDALGGGQHAAEFESGMRLPEIRGDGSGDFISKGWDAMGDVIRIPSRTIQAESDFAYVVNYRGQIGALAYRNARSEALSRGLSGSAAGEFIQYRAAYLTQNPTASMVEGAHSLAQTNTFTTPLGPIGGAFNSFLDKTGDYAPGLGRMLFPFRKVPINLAKFSIGHSPLALLTRSFYSDMQTGGAAGQLALAKLGMGSAVSLMAGELYMNGWITGGGPTDIKDYKNQIATGWKPYAIHDGKGNYYTFDRLDPVGEMLGLPADFMTIMGEAPQADVEHAGVALASTIGRNMTRQSYVETLANVNKLIDALKSGDSMSSALAKFGAQEVSGVIPAALRGEAKREDPVLRDTRGFMDTLLSNVPGYSKNLPPRRDLEGKPIITPPGFMANEVYPFQVGAEAHNPIANEVFETGASPQKPPDVLPGSGRAPKMNDQPQNPDVGVPLDKFQKDRWQVLRATYRDEQQGTMSDALKSAVADPDYKDLAKEDKAKVLEKIVLEYGKAATELLLAESPDLQKKYALRQQYKALGHMPPGGNPQAFLRDNGIEPAPEIR